MNHTDIIKAIDGIRGGQEKRVLKNVRVILRGNVTVVVEAIIFT